MRGIILISTGHPGYGKMAYNLTMTIKAAEDIPVAIVVDDVALNHLTETQKGIFDYIIPIGDYPAGFGAKLHLDELTPFTKTLYMDVDMLWLSKKPTELFDELNGVPFKTITEGNSNSINHKYYFWADVEEIKKEYKVDKVYQIRSEVIYFEKKTVFKKARELDPRKKLNTIRMFGDHIPDELYFNIAVALLKIDIETWMPAYWSRLNNEVMPNLSVLHKNYYMLSFGSNIASPVMKRTYDNVMMVAARKLGLMYMFKLKSKKEWAPGRLKI